MTKKRQILVVGAGAAGMTAAITAARQGAEVTLLEHTQFCGKKLSATGNGKCNMTNRIQEKHCYRSDCPEFAWKALQHFTVSDTIHFFADSGLLMRDKNGYFYPMSEQASSVVDILKQELKRNKINIVFGTEIHRVKLEQENIFCIDRENQVFCGEALILATGSKAAPKTGSDGSGYFLAQQMGHTIVKPLPALVQLIGEGSYWKMLAGVRVQARVSLYIEDKLVMTEEGELQLTDYGLSGIPIFQLSRYAVRAKDKQKKVSVMIDFLPQMSIEEIKIFIKGLIKIKQKTAEESLNGLFHKKITAFLLKYCCISAETSRVTQKEINRLADTIKGFQVSIVGSKTFEQCQVCSGGVNVREINPETMESLLCKNIFFAGEIIDVDGACGGYNLQWAWTSGFLAGFHAAKIERKRKCYDSNSTNKASSRARRR